MCTRLHFVALVLGSMLCAAGTATRAADQPTPGAALPATLAAQPGDETRMLDTADGKFANLVRAARGGEVHGTLVLLPADGAHPAAGAALERLRHDLPSHGWTTWLIGLEPPPGVHTERIEPDAQRDDSTQALPDAQRAAQIEAWVKRGEARIGVALNAARALHPTVVLAAAGPAAALLLRALPDTTAALLVDPVALPGLALAWPQPLPVPVMEILRPALAVQRLPPARPPGGDKAAQYRRLVMEATSVEPFGVETLLTRRVRGWLTTLAQPPAAAGAD